MNDFYELIKLYPDVLFGKGGKGIVSFCSYNYNVVVLSSNIYGSNNHDDMFVVLHEVGHARTSTDDMPEYMREYRATEWAIKESKKLGIKVSKKYQKMFQEDIYKYMKNLNISKEQVKLNW